MGRPLLSDLLSDLRFAARLLRRNPGFSLVAIFSLALGIGASSAIFSLIYAVLLDPYPYRAADRMANPSFIDKQDRRGTMQYTVPDFMELRAVSRTTEDAILVDRTDWTITGGIPEQVGVDRCSPNFFDFMAVPAILGRNPAEKDITQPSSPPPIAVISYLFWQKHFNGSHDVLNRTLELNHQLYNIMAVLPARFTWNDADVYVPMPMVASLETFPVLARLKPGMNLRAFDKELQALTERFAKRARAHIYPSEFRFAAEWLNDWLLGKFRGTLLILMAAVAFLLLIACGNVSILLLARAAERQKEIATRLSVGAGRFRIVRQLLTESVLLSLIGGLLGVLVAYRSVPAIVALMPEYSVPHEAVIAVNGIVVLFTFVISVATGILFGMAPALQLANPDLRNSMQEAGRSTTAGSVVGRTRNLLVVAEVALTMVLLVGAGVALRGFWALLQKPLGFRSDHVLALGVRTQPGSFKTWEARKAFYDQILNKFRQTPGVSHAAATITAMPPWIGFQTSAELLNRSGKDRTQPVLVGAIADDYFQTAGIAFLAGRLFTPFDLERNGAVAVINDEMRRQYWPDGQNPIGEKVRLPELDFTNNPYVLQPASHAQIFEIVGVVATALNRGLEDKPRPAIYIPYGDVLPPFCSFLVRTKGDPGKLIVPLQQQMRKINPDQPLLEIRPLDENLRQQGLAYPRFSTTLFTLFAAVALSLAAAGIFSVVSFAVTRRTREFGIRMALGAKAGDILSLVSGMTARLMLVGIVIGLAASLALGRVISNYLEGWNPKDPVALVGVTVILLLAAATACYIPARRAVRIQPMTALRHE